VGGIKVGRHQKRALLKLIAREGFNVFLTGQEHGKPTAA